MRNVEQPSLKLCLHGLAVRIAAPGHQLDPYSRHLLRPFLVSDLPERVAATTGLIGSYNTKDVLQHLSSSARRVPQTDPWLELYQDGDRFWLVDERWGISEINLLRSQWRSWVLPSATADPVRRAEGAILWPLSQLLRPRGLHLLPAVALARDGCGTLILAPFSIEPELTRLMAAGYRLVSQRWTALRHEDGHISLLHMPGVVDRAFPPRLRTGTGVRESQWVDLAAQFPDSSQNHAFCDTVLIVEPGRRSVAHASDLSVPEAEQMLRGDWPIADIHPSRRSPQIPQRIARSCRCVQIQLSRNPDDLVVLMDSLRDTMPRRAPRVALFIRTDHLPRDLRHSA